jgi:hypothetical protein
MSATVVQVFGTLIGVLVGGAVSAGTAMLLYRRQRRDALDAERRAREMAATSRIQDAVASLLGLEPGPDEVYDRAASRRYRRGKSTDDRPPAPDPVRVDEWHRRRDDLLLTLETARLDLSSESLRARLERAQRALRNPSGPWDIEHQPESMTRRIVCRHVLECVGAFRRGDPLPSEPKEFTGTIASVDEWIGWQEDQEQYMKEEWAKQRQARRDSSSPPPE